MAAERDEGQNVEIEIVVRYGENRDVETERDVWTDVWTGGLMMEIDGESDRDKSRFGGRN